ncbi:exocyst complex component EXO70B1 [Brachypodium distachyon]|uniref:Exocyst subunit Exo70 family protein n=1 Tax=Brachypodium distachyon TaxID=15368 RepID=I1IN88_BRADI|nr:exocyst complex component EXO70B1 [Brachypodium distachyon]PNT64113.1 hypothetical protein BRADI_4g24680v3 [Brachypodium distachyon]|eukprot:XP_014758405.1 exocyst complex component EXO70B1 [Brachypodium distachyon]
MERIPIPMAMLPQKSSSFSQATVRQHQQQGSDHEKLGRNLSLGAIKLSEHVDRLKKESAAAAEEASSAAAAGGEEAEPPPYEEPDLAALSVEIDAFLASRAEGDSAAAISEVTLDRFASAVEMEIAATVEGDDDRWASAAAEDGGGGGEQKNPPRVLLDAIRRISTLAAALTTNNAAPAAAAAETDAAATAGGGNKKGYTIGVHRVTGVLHRAMAFLEDELYALLEDIPSNSNPGSAKAMRRPPSFSAAAHGADSDRCVLPLPSSATATTTTTPETPAGAGGDNSSASNSNQPQPLFPPETVDRLRAMADAMAHAGYSTECEQVFLISRRNALDSALQALGYEKASIDDVVKMSWESLEAEIGAWIKAFRHVINVGLSAEHDLCVRVFPPSSSNGNGNGNVGKEIFADLARCALLQMLNFTEAVAMAKRAAEKLFKVLDMYEAIRDSAPVVDAFLDMYTPNAGTGHEALSDLQSELASVQSRLGESAAAIFCDLESSIRADAGKQPVPGGAVHPLTRYLMNYLKYACEYKNTLEQVFRQHHHRPDSDDPPPSSTDNNSSSNNNNNNANTNENNPFAAQLMEVMELLHGNLEAKSRLYKDPALSSIFLMNNGRYMLQKIRGSPEINAVVGEAWARKRSTDLRQYHKNYQRETWNRVLNMLRDDGSITVKGHVQKPVLKERFKQFNAAMDEIHRNQGSWVVSDDQLQSELRVSIAAVVVPAYRSFLGRFAQSFSAGRQTEKYIKLSADDLENIIDELFDGNTASMPRRRN